MRKIVAIRVDVDTSVGLKKGVPKLLEIFSRYDVPATFFVVMGPDTMGKHAKRFKKKNYFKRIRKVNPFKLSNLLHISYTRTAVMGENMEVEIRIIFILMDSKFWEVTFLLQPKFATDIWMAY